MDATQSDGEQARAESALARTPERARAAAYLDLWERHVSQAAIHALGPVLPRPKA